MTYEMPTTMNCPIHGPDTECRYIGEGMLQVCAECDPEESGDWDMPVPPEEIEDGNPP